MGTLTIPCSASSPGSSMGGGDSPGHRRRSRLRSLGPCIAKKDCNERRGSGPRAIPDGEELRIVKWVRDGRSEEDKSERWV